VNVTNQNQLPADTRDRRYISVTRYPRIGHAEMSVVKVTNRKHHERIASVRDEQTEEAQRVAISRARQVVAKKCRAIGAARMLTLTTREPVTDLDAFWKLFQRFLQRCRRSGLEFQYVAVPELQKRGAWHVHVAIDRFLPHSAIYAEWVAVVGSGTSDLHFFRAGNDAERCIAVAGYISKYIGKALMGSDFGRKRYRCSKGIEIEKETFETDRVLVCSPHHLACLFHQETDLLPRSVRVNDYGGKWVASWGDTMAHAYPEDELPT
jgi:hypothetical protein